jgi:hypothetical protein
MAQQIINVGSAANDGTGDPVRDAFLKANANFAELYAQATTWIYVKLASPFTTSSATAVNAGLAFTPAANTSYEFEARLLTRTATTTVGARPGITWPTGLTDGVVIIKVASAAGAQVLQNGNISAAVLAPVGGFPNTTASWPAEIRGFFIAGATPSGAVNVTLASETAGTNVSIQTGSFLRYRALP